MIKSLTSLSDVRSSVRAAFWDRDDVAPPSPSTRKVEGSGFAEDPRRIMESLSACTETTPPRANMVGKSPSALSSTQSPTENGEAPLHSTITPSSRNVSPTFCKTAQASPRRSSGRFVTTARAVGRRRGGLDVD